MNAKPPTQSFDALGLPAPLLKTMTGLGVKEPFPIQAATLPDALAGRDILGRARTGSGKTLAFGLALLARTAGLRAEPKRPLALVLVPTRELAQQVGDALEPYARALGVRLATAVGGLSINRQSAELKAGADVLIATPGRLADLVSRRYCHLGQVRITVLDEADQMCDLGFLPQVSEIVGQVRPDGQRLLFSATLDGAVDQLVRDHLRDPLLVSVDAVTGPVETMEHHVLNVHPADKYATATEIAARDGRVLMFLDTKAGVDRFTRHLRDSGVRAAALHSGKSQPQRTHTLAQFKEGAVTVLVATNVAARGIHIDALDLVVNVDPPADAKDYLHRGGRTARAGESGNVVTLVTPDQRRDVNRMMTEAGIRPTVTQVRSGEARLTAITGAKRPPAAAKTSGGNAPFRGLGARPGRAKESRKTSEARKAAEARAAARVRRAR
ncbi:DEAD/DEAH box helicase [Streptomyces thermolilacinus]|uniref:RNA helicase n=1 Tax=Streptomyces thermolilacinus SPC6 TaxID=1306406 RepID=A0A1D3DYL7_9ACTN|nr:DEAD/DEAH box helicase [Streptomyces thermolilacinus]OEJ97419.1 RNA helicase [Streptomyces thermolilacinus SPC6]